MAEDLGADPGTLRPRIVSAAATAALGALEQLYGDDPGELDDPMAVVDEAITFLRGGVDALSGKPPPAA